jgi:hypothetical protein
VTSPTPADLAELQADIREKTRRINAARPPNPERVASIAALIIGARLRRAERQARGADPSKGP